ncbi:ankyrin repeat domain-containing protein [Myroides sp. LJL116]
MERLAMMDREIIRSFEALLDQKKFSEIEKLLQENPSFFEEYVSVYDSALEYAVVYGDLETLVFISEVSKIPLDQSLTKYKTVLGYAGQENKMDCVLWLLENGAKVDGNTTDLISPLMSTVMSGNYEIAKTLIDHGADVNRMHLRTGYLPLDEAKGRGKKDIEELLIKAGAKSHFTLPDWIEDKASGILEHLSLKFDRILPFNIPTPLAIGKVQLKLVPVNNRNNRMLFTYGLYDVCIPRIELFIVLPQYWNFYDQDAANQFPILFISRVIELIQNGLVVKEGDYLLKTNPSFSDLQWEDIIAGFFIIDVSWKSKKSVDMPQSIGDNTQDTVKLLTLIPVKSTKSGYSKLSVEASRNSGWQKLTLPINGKK